jgi:hypothetical protein
MIVYVLIFLSQPLFTETFIDWVAKMTYIS